MAKKTEKVVAKKATRTVAVAEVVAEMPDLQGAIDRVGVAINMHQTAFTAYSAYLLTLEGIAVQKLEGSKVEVAQEIWDQLDAALAVLTQSTKMITL